jgi:predicted dehydrogenase/threonine dehydrogenase-like Zn-dependent dehydrogenase
LEQVVQSLRSGRLSVKTIPEPLVRPQHVLIANEWSLISAGTEKMVMDLARRSLLGKARERPDQVRRVIQKMRHEGLLATVRQVGERLDEPMAMGYSSAGVVLACGSGVQGLKPGDRVASNGPHAGIVCVPKHLCARVPDEVALEQAAFTVLGAIALQGARLARVDLGSTALVVGLGLVGQLAVALLRASGVQVLGTDPDASKCDLALRMGAQVARPGLSAGDVEALTGGLGADAVLIAASTSSSQPMELAAQAVRKKGRIVLVGVVGLELDRRPFYFKECEFVVSCSYGPGRYDPEYEERGRDYPAAHVRWTEERNFEAMLGLMASGRIDVSPLISHRFRIADAEQAYALIEQAQEPYLGVLLQYGASEDRRRRVELRAPAPMAAEGMGYGCLGAGNFARLVLLPALERERRLRPVLLGSAGGLSAEHTGSKLGFDAVTTDEEELFRDPKVQVVFVLTRHDQHGRQVAAALRAGKHVFTEKPLCLTVEELLEIESLLEAAGSRAPLVMVGFNRRFSPAALAARQAFEGVSAPLTVSVRFNSGTIPAEHWTQDDETGGGRIIGEACHAIDLATFLAGSPVVRVYAESVGGRGAPAITDDQCFITLRHASGSVSSVAYLAGGDRALPKERIEIIGGGRVAVVDDFREVTVGSGGRLKHLRGWGQDKGHVAEIAAFTKALLSGGPPPIPWEELRATSLASILAVRSLREGVPFDLP